jgi:hypothetical protein
MGKLQFYSNYLNNVAKSPNREWREEQQAFVSEMFDNSTIVRHDVYEENYPFDFNFVNNPDCWVSTVLDVTTGMVKNSDDYRSLYFKNIDHEVGRGRYFKWLDNYWIVYETTTHELETISTCNIRRCNNWLKWLNDKGEVITYPCVIEGDLTSANAQVAKTITQANSHINVIVQGNKDTLSIVKNSRFMFNHNVYKFYSINNYMQVDYVDDNAPLLFMDFYLDMEIDEDNVAENLADDLRNQYHIECNVEQLTGQIGNEGVIIPTVYRNNKTIDDVRMEFVSSDDNIITVDKDGNYLMRSNGEAVISVQILGNEISKIDIPIIVTDVSQTTYSIIVNPIVSKLRKGLSVTFSAKIVNNLNEEISDVITLVPSGTDNKNNYTIVDNGDNTWVLTNNLQSTIPLTLTFSNTTYNVETSMEVQLKAMF